jgi:Domain of unknown function (DUF4333)
VMVTSRSFARPLAGVALAAGIVAGCSSTPVLDNDRLQQVIEQGLQDQVQVTATVTCPDNQPIQQGNVFNCQAVTSEGTNLTIQVTQTDDTGHVNWQVVSSS